MAAPVEKALKANTAKQLLRGIEKAKVPVTARGASAIDPAREKAAVEISDDLEKDINIDVHILNNTASMITHHSHITINYYNVGEQDATEARHARGVRKHSVYLPEADVRALDELKRELGKDYDALAEAAYRLLLAKHRKAGGSEAERVRRRPSPRSSQR